MKLLTLNLGQLMRVLYAEYLLIYRDADLAAMATASMINQLIENSVDETERVLEDRTKGRSS
ncbi:hypothetical protein COY25_00200 [Candidatus Uhrbacteria bacterium CG_4_10_14_0_2_um_filter_41_7]|nr:MAG: hypothetical protein COV92_01610 [Candidatus Uhrbacteria bacterium CG11_big_fil_rev_8_21_14_0_20_41_9]PIZ55810.1 MAG: hypothetical protein COY25_00200 [Candidatus Uhrbacteria bacterium CG_4_10_14_0_2_um_filter_41_7]